MELRMPVDQVRAEVRDRFLKAGGEAENFDALFDRLWQKHLLQVVESEIAREVSHITFRHRQASERQPETVPNRGSLVPNANWELRKPKEE